MTDFTEDDDLFLSDIGDLSQIYSNDGRPFSKKFSSNSRFMRKPSRNSNFHDDNDFGKRFRNTQLNKNRPNSKPQKSENIGDASNLDGPNLYDDDDVFVSDSRTRANEFRANLSSLKNPSYEQFEFNENEDNPNKNEICSRSKPSLSDSLDSFMKSQNTEGQSWLKSKSNDGPTPTYDRNPVRNPESAGAFLNKEDAEKRAFGKWFVTSPEKSKDDKKNSDDRSSNKMSHFKFLSDDKFDSRELLDENYPTVNPLEASKTLKALKFSFDKSEDRLGKHSPKEFDRDKTTRQKMLGLKKRFENEDDVVVVPEDRRSDVSPKVPAESPLSETNISNMIKSIQVNYGRQIPVLNKKPAETPSTTPFSIPVPPPKPICSQFNAPPVMMPDYSNSHNYNMSNPNFGNPFQANPNMFPSYAGPTMMNNPPPPEFFNNTSQSMGYSHFSENTHRPPPAQNNWMPPMNPVMNAPMNTSMNPPMNPSIISASHSGQCIPVEETKSAGEEMPRRNKPADNEAVRNELRQQNVSLMAQRDSYNQKYKFLNEELEKLKAQKKDLLENKKSHQNEKYLKTNHELQADIQSKLKAVKNVIDMLSKIIKDDDDPKKSSSKTEDTKKPVLDEKKESSKSSKDRKSRRKSRSRSRSRHKSRSRSRGHRSRSPRSRSPKRHRRRSRSKDKYPSRRRSSERYQKPHPKSREKPKPAEEGKVAEKEVPEPVKTVVESSEVVTPQADTNKRAERFKSTFEEVKNSLATSASPSEPPSAKSELRKSESASEPSRQNVNYVYYDPEIHWCQVCDVFPRTAKEYLLHLHDTQHKDELTKRNMIDHPWHKYQTDARKAVDSNAPTERIPIRGLPFFVSAAAWYCKLCNQWMGDLHCASAHLKSDVHEAKYAAFIESNHIWEETWTQSRSKALELYTRSQTKQNDVFTCAEPPFKDDSNSGGLKLIVRPLKPAVPAKRRSRSSSNSSSSSSSSCSSSTVSSSSSSSSDDTQKSKSAKRKKQNKGDFKSNKNKNTLETKSDPEDNSDHEKDKPKDYFQPNKNEDDKFVEEWMNPVRGKSKEREFQELKDKLKKKDLEERRRPADIRRRADEALKLDYKKDKNSPEKSNNAKNETSAKNNTDKGIGKKDDQPTKKLLDKPIVFNKSNKFPFIGKMPSRSLKKAEQNVTAGNTAVESEKQPPAKKTSGNNQELSEAIKKHLEEYEKALDPEQDNTVVDMDINEEEDEPVSIVIDDNISRQKDFEETLNLLYPDENKRNEQASNFLPPMNQPPPMAQLPQMGQPMTQQAVMGPQNPHQQLPPNFTEDYLVSLIENTVMERLKLRFPGIENTPQLAQMMQQSLMSGPGSILPTESTPPSGAILCPPGTDATNVPISLADVQLPPNLNGKQNIGVEKEGGSVTSGSEADVPNLVKKKKNPMSQKKRRHLAKIRQKLEEQEKQLQAKIEETRRNREQLAEAVESVYSSVDMISEPVVMNVDSDLMLLGIDEDDSAALQF